MGGVWKVAEGKAQEGVQTAGRGGDDAVSMWRGGLRWTNFLCALSMGLGVKGLGCIWPWVGVELQRLGILGFVFLLLIWSLGNEKENKT